MHSANAISAQPQALHSAYLSASISLCSEARLVGAWHGVDEATPGGRYKERQLEGIAKAKAVGVYKGRPGID
jgi:hypothetical protein